MWRENGEHVLRYWFLERKIKQSSPTCDGFLSSDTFKGVVETINNVDIRELGDASLPGTPPLDQMLKSQRINVLERELTFYRGKVRDIEVWFMATSLETTLKTPAVGSLIRQHCIFNFLWVRKQEQATKIWGINLPAFKLSDTLGH